MKNGELKIEKGIPVPPKPGGGRKGYGPAMKAMRKGDSVLLPVKAYANAWTTSMTHLGRGNFEIRKEGQKFRVWRTA